MHEYNDISIFLLILLCLGIIFCIVPIIILKRRSNIIRDGKTTKAVVMKSVLKISRHGNRSYNYYYPVLKYTVNGQDYEITHNFGREKPKYKDGDVVDIVYNQLDPKKIVMANSKNEMILSIIFGAIGLLLVLLGIGIRIVLM